MRLRLLSALLPPAIVACSDPATPGGRVDDLGPPGVRIIEGRTGSDTIESTLPIVAEMRDANGRPMPNMQIEFRNDGRVQLKETATGPGYHRVVMTTDANGRARAWVFLNWYAGSAQAYVGAAGIGFDTATYTVKPGVPVSVRATTTEVVYVPVSGTFTPGFMAVDRRNNAVAGSAITVTGSPRVSVGASNLVTANAAGLAWVYGTAGAGSGARDSVLVSVLPPFTLAYEIGPAEYLAQYSAFVRRLDGSASQLAGRAMNGYYTGGLDWSPDGTRLLHGGQLTTLGVRQDTLPVPTGYVRHPLMDTKFSPDGEWIYLTARQAGTQVRSLFRMRVATREFEELLPGGETSYEQPAISPDGATLVMVSYTTATPVGTRALVRMDIATRTVTPLNVVGAWPRYTPDGSRLLFVLPVEGAGRLASMPAAGGAVTTISPELVRRDGFGISPDGVFAAVARPHPYSCSQLHLMRLSNGEISPLPITGDMNNCVTSTAFKP